MRLSLALILVLSPAALAGPLPSDPFKIDPFKAALEQYKQEVPSTKQGGRAAIQPSRPTFPYWAGHSCPTCGRGVFLISGRLPDGSHFHRCPYDGTAWKHF